MTDPAVAHRVLQRGGDVLLTDQLGEPLRSVLAVQGLVGHGPTVASVNSRKRGSRASPKFRAPPRSGRSAMLQRLARTMYRRRRYVLVGWIVLLVATFMLVEQRRRRVQDRVQAARHREPGRVRPAREVELPQPPDPGPDRVRGQDGVDDARGAAGDGAALRRGRAEDRRRRRGEPLLRGGRAAGVAEREDRLRGGQLRRPVGRGVHRRGQGDQAASPPTIEVPGLTVEFGGDVFADPEVGGASEAIGIAAAMIILLIAFGSVLAMGLPIGTALFGIGTGIAIVLTVRTVVDMPDFTTAAVAMVGLGVGIDYALFIVTRYRENLAAGLDPERSVVRAIDTAGRAVLFAGTTVVISVLGLLLMKTSIMRGVAIGISIGVLTTMLASVTLLPALLGFVGRNIDKFGLPHRKRPEGDDQGVGLDTLEPRHPAPPVAGRHHRPRGPAPAVGPAAVDAPRLHRRRQPADRRHHAPGLRPGRRRLRRRVQRPAAPRRRDARTATTDLATLNELTRQAQRHQGRRLRHAAAGQRRRHGRGDAGLPHHRPAGRGHRRPREPPARRRRPVGHRRHGST